MAPIPATYDEEASELIVSIQRRQTDVSEFQIPRLRECKGPMATHEQLAGELREDVDVLSRSVEELEVLVGDQIGERNQRALKAVVDDFRESLIRLRKDSRTALLSSKRTVDARRSNSMRDELLKSSAVAGTTSSSNEKVTDDILMKTNDDVTEALRRTVGLMQGELEKSVLSSQMLDSSTATLRSTSSTHDNLSTLMSTSKHLITALEKSDWVDRLLIIMTTIFFFLVVALVLKERVVDRGVGVVGKVGRGMGMVGKGMFWWTRFVPDFSGDAALMEEGRRVVSTLASTKTMMATETKDAVSSTVLEDFVTTTTSLVRDAVSSPPSIIVEDLGSQTKSLAEEVASVIGSSTSALATSVTTSIAEHVEL